MGVARTEVQSCSSQALGSANLVQETSLGPYHHRYPVTVNNSLSTQQMPGTVPRALQNAGTLTATVMPTLHLRNLGTERVSVLTQPDS